MTNLATIPQKKRTVNQSTVRLFQPQTILNQRCVNNVYGEDISPITHFTQEIKLIAMPVIFPVRPVPCLTPKALCLLGYDLIVSYDTEYQEVLTASGRKRNKILSYQWTAVIKHAGGEYRLCENIIFVDDSTEDHSGRLTFAELLKDVFDKFSIGRRKASKFKLLVIAHYGVAEWAALRDRKKFAESHDLTVVRGVPISFRPIDVAVGYGSDNYATPAVQLRDTSLIAPGKASLEAIGKMLIHGKVELPEGSIENMEQLVIDDVYSFMCYGIGDTRAALEYFLSFNLTYQELFPNVNKMPLTLGGASVAAYLDWLNQHETLTKEVVFGHVIRKQRISGKSTSGKPQTYVKDVPFEQRTRKDTNSLAADAYIGGYNAAFVQGDRDFTGTDKIILDIDLIGAYITAMAVEPVIDFSKPYSPILTLENVDSFHATGGIRGTVPMQLLHVEFEFPSSCEYPCLPVNSEMGPKYPYLGESVCTGVEVALAQKFGARIGVRNGVSFQTVRNADGERYLAFADYLGMLARAREREQNDNPKSLMGALLKELGNSFYGKQCQGVDDRTIYNLSGQGEKLAPSAITCPQYAAITTGIVRAALISIITEIHKIPGCEVLSATTDGCMIVVPLQFIVTTNDKGIVIPPSVEEGLGRLLDGLWSYPTIRALEQGRVNLGVKNVSWIEIKHVGDKAVTARTRGYHLSYNGVTQHFARAATQVNNPKEWERIFLADGIERFKGRHLATIREIMDGDSLDLVDDGLERTINLDWDYGRTPLNDGTGRTRAPMTIDEVRKYRAAMDSVRKIGIRATPEAVALKLNNVHLGGGTPVAVRRAIHRAVIHDIAGWKPKGMVTMEIMRRLGIDNTYYQNQKRAKFTPQCLPNTPETLDIITEIATALGLAVTSQMTSVFVV